MKTMMLSLLVMFITACSGTVYTVKNPEFKDGKTKGVLFYGYKLASKNVIYDRIRNPITGEITNTAYVVPSSKEYCKPVSFTTKVVVADYDTFYAVTYQPGLFETNTFSVELDKGMLKSVNTESTPGLIESLQGIATLREDILDGISTTDKQALNSPVDTPAIPCTTNK